MPQINRIRVNNVKYNFGTQSYDDFMMKPFGRNTLYDLANGGGKSVLMLLMLQNMIPNCTLDEKQPIEKLFRTSDGSTTIHSLIEWKLDEACIKDGFKYMTTGFCARKAADDETAERDTASIEYFNYCIFYREYNENDIRNLPLIKDKERITFTGLKKYLKELEHNASLVVKIFERKGEYQSFISNYGIYESQWEIIKGINKTEGHVRAYFETNYKNTRKVVEDLLIEEIIKTSFRMKSGGDENSDAMSKTLLDMKDKLVELAKKKDEIGNYDRQTQILSEFCRRIETLQGIYHEKNAVELNLNRIYNAAVYYAEAKQAEWEKSKEQADALDREQVLIDEQIDVAKLAKEQKKYEKYVLEARALESRETELRAEYDSTVTDIRVRECMNDYLEYLEDRKKCDEARQTIAAMRNGKEGLSDSIKELVYGLKFRIDGQKKAVEKEITSLERSIEKETAEKNRLDEVDNMTGREITKEECAIAQAESDIRSHQSEISGLKQEISLLVTEDLHQNIEENAKNIELNLLKIKELAEEEERNEKELEESKKTLIIRELQIKQHAQEIEDSEKELKAGDEVKARVNKLFAVYGKNDINELYGEIKRRYKETILREGALLSEKTEKEKESAAITEGTYFMPAPEIEEIVNYIRVRHKAEAMSGYDYVSGMDTQDMKDLLVKYPYIFNSVIVTGYEEIIQDSYLPEKLGKGLVVPVIKIESLKAEKDIINRAQIALLTNDRLSMTDERKRETESAKIKGMLAELERNMKRVSDSISDMEKDLVFTGHLIADGIYAVNTIADRTDALKLTLAAEKNEVSQLSDMVQQLTAKSRDIKEKKTGLENEKQMLSKEKDVLAEIKKYITKISVCSERAAASAEKIARLKNDRTETQKAIRGYEESIFKSRSKLSYMKDMLNNYEQLWHNKYERFYENGAYDIPLKGIEELISEIDGKLEASGADIAAIDDKQRLVDSYEQSMNRAVKNISRRKMTLAELDAMYGRSEVFRTADDELARLQGNADILDRMIIDTGRELDEARYDQKRSEGKISSQESIITERYGRLLMIDEIPANIDEFIDGKKLQKKSKANEKKSLEAEVKVLFDDMQRLSDIRKDIERCFKNTGFELDPLCGKIENNVTLSEVFHTTEGEYQLILTRLEKKKSEFEKNKQLTMESLRTLGAYALASEISESVNMPKDEEETLRLIKNLHEVNECLSLEKERTYAGIGDTLKIKENFENQCLQRCVNIKADIERFSKLSKIYMDGEQIPVVSLSIPYVKEELYKERMSAYIDEVISETDKIKENAERLKYIKSALALKKLFAVIVTDMNAIKLTLYKRERIKEQSRHLKYEEAVGSTGQSQGIYIQFLIAVINYIACINSSVSDANGLTKTIFIDNPFGAAKDVYIWEPIFKLLETNNVQLIVPARGTTPAITGRFDVNYLLGQKIIDGKQQTVVVDYHSQVDAAATEYIPLEFEQTQLVFD